MWTASVDSARTAASGPEAVLQPEQTEQQSDSALSSRATTADPADTDSVSSMEESFSASSSTTGEGSCKSCGWVGNVSRWQGGARLSAMTDDELLAHGIRRSMLDRAAWLDSRLAAGDRRRNAPTFDEAPVVTARPTTAGARGPSPIGAAGAASGIDGPHGEELADGQDRAANRMTASATHIDEGQQNVVIVLAMRSSSPEAAAVATVARPEDGGLNLGPAGQAGHESERSRRARLCREAAEKRAGR